MELKRLIENLTCDKDQKNEIGVLDDKEFNFDRYKIFPYDKGIKISDTINSKETFIKYRDIKVISLIDGGLFVISEIKVKEINNKMIINISR